MGSKGESKDGEFQGEKYLGETSFETPTPSSPDTCITNTLSCSSAEECVLRGDYEMDECRGLPHLTLGLIKPDGMQFLHQIEKRIRDEGFDIVQSRELQLSPEQASNFYYEHYGQPYFPLLIMTMCEGPIKVYVLRKKNAVFMWRMLCGPVCVDEAKKVWPESLRALYGKPGESFKNVCHGPATEEKAREEIRFFFHSMVLEDNFRKESDVIDYLKEFVNPTLLEGLTQICKNKPLDPVEWLAVWLLTNNPYKPKLQKKVALTVT